MKYLTLIYLLSIGLYCTVKAQIQQDVNSKKKITVLLSDGSLSRGILNEVKDSTIVIFDPREVEDHYNGRFKSYEFHFNRINAINIKSKVGVKKGMLFGALATFGIASIAGLKGPEDILINGIISTIFLGVPFGALLGSLKRQIRINGNYEQFVMNKSVLIEYLSSE